VVFGKIEYLNLLPFHIFMKRYAKTLRHHATIDYKKGVPSKINREFFYRRVDAAFISTASIKRRDTLKSKLGIVAKKEVLSVLLIPQEESIKDSASATSNLLADILHLQGEVIIGDRALKYYLQEENSEKKVFVDLAYEWQKRYHLPFSFALLSYHKNSSQIDKICNQFLKNKIYIPQYLLSVASERSGISKSNILYYLSFISYNIDYKTKKSINKFKALSQYKNY